MYGDIYKYTDYDPSVVMEKVDDLREQIEDEKMKGNESDKEKLRKLAYAQFIQGLKLSTGMRLY